MDQQSKVPSLKHAARQPGLAGRIMSLITLRRMYQILAFDAEDHLVAEYGPDISELFGETMDCVAEAAKKDYKFDDVAKLWPGVSAAASDHLARLETLRVQFEQEDKDAAMRRQTAPIPFGFAWNGDGQTSVEDRSRSVLLVGPRLKVYEKMRQIAGAASKDKLPVLYLTGEYPEIAEVELKNEGHSMDRIYLVPLAVWHKTAATVGSFLSVLKRGPLTTVEGLLPSVVIVEELSLTKAPSFAGQPAELTAAAAHSNVNRGCQTMGSLLVAGLTWEDGKVPFDLETDEQVERHLNGPLFDQFRTFSRVVRVREDGSIACKDSTQLCN